MKKIILGIIAFVGFLILMSSFTVVDVGERKLVVGFGEIKTTLVEGIHLVNPLYSVHTFTLRNNRYDTIAMASTQDIQKANVSITVNYDTNEGKIQEIYTKYGNDFVEKVFSQNVQEAVKSASAKYTATELVTKRDDFKASVKDSLQEKMPDIINIVTVNITNIDYSEGFNQSVESKVKAEQDALTAKANLEQKKYEADAIKAQAEAINQAGGQEYVQLKAIEKWDGKLPTYTSDGPMPFIGNVTTK